MRFFYDEKGQKGLWISETSGCNHAVHPRKHLRVLYEECLKFPLKCNENSSYNSKKGGGRIQK